MTKQDCIAQLLVCADARILYQQAGHLPVREVEDGKDTGRVAHERRGDELHLVFEDVSVLVALS